MIIWWIICFWSYLTLRGNEYGKLSNSWNEQFLKSRSNIMLESDKPRDKTSSKHAMKIWASILNVPFVETAETSRRSWRGECSWLYLEALVTFTRKLLQTQRALLPASALSRARVRLSIFLLLSLALFLCIYLSISLVPVCTGALVTSEWLRARWLALREEAAAGGEGFLAAVSNTSSYGYRMIELNMLRKLRA